MVTHARVVDFLLTWYPTIVGLSDTPVFHWPGMCSTRMTPAAAVVIALGLLGGWIGVGRSISSLFALVCPCHCRQTKRPLRKGEILVGLKLRAP